MNNLENASQKVLKIVENLQPVFKVPLGRCNFSEIGTTEHAS